MEKNRFFTGLIVALLISIPIWIGIFGIGNACFGAQSETPKRGFKISDCPIIWQKNDIKRNMIYCGHDCNYNDLVDRICSYSFIKDAIITRMCLILDEEMTTKELSERYINNE